MEALLQQLYGWIGFAVCHQLPERTLVVGSSALPVCARDTGIYVGFVVSYLLLVLLGRERPTEMPPRWLIALCGLFFVIMAVDGVTSYAGLRTTDNDIRLITGLLAGFSLPPLLKPIINYQFWRKSSRTHLLDNRKDLAIWFAAIPAAFLLVKYHPFPLGLLLPAFLAAAVLFSFSTVNALMVSMIPPLERRATTLWGTAPFWLIGLLMTFFELAVAVQMHAFALASATR
ncbi:MAG: DUF2085 domain-containing protein [Actinobacteria bacterium]|nr:MAG: DUF2085 domain-containing protein [Actinomycetota bacterium]